MTLKGNKCLLKRKNWFLRKSKETFFNLFRDTGTHWEHYISLVHACQNTHIHVTTNNRFTDLTILASIFELTNGVLDLCHVVNIWDGMSASKVWENWYIWVNCSFKYAELSFPNLQTYSISDSLVGYMVEYREYR